MVRHALDRGYEVVGVCRMKSVYKLREFEEQISIVPGKTNDRRVIKQAVAGCHAVLTVLVPWGMHHYSSDTAQAVMDFSEPDARLIFSCGTHITMDGKDVYSQTELRLVRYFRWFGRAIRMIDLDDQVEACRRVFENSGRWTVVRAPDLDEGPSEGLPVWSEHVGDPILASGRVRRSDYALFMVDAISNDALIQKAPAIVGCKAESVRKDQKKE